MRPIHFRAISVGALAFLTFVGGAAAQTKSSPVLNSLEVQKLIKSAEPADHARLSAHFAVLSDEHAAEAKKHTAMAQAFIGNPNRQVATMNAHCTRLAELNTKSAATLRELATHHNQLAAGKTSPVPPGAGSFEAGAGAPAPTEKELNVLAARATSPAEHGALQEYFQTLAKRYMAEAKEHATMAQAYRGTKVAQSAAHCDRLVMISRDAAREATVAAAMHKEAATGKR